MRSGRFHACGMRRWIASGARVLTAHHVWQTISSRRRARRSRPRARSRRSPTTAVADGLQAPLRRTAAGGGRRPGTAEGRSRVRLAREAMGATTPGRREGAIGEGGIGTEVATRATGRARRRRTSGAGTAANAGTSGGGTAGMSRHMLGAGLTVAADGQMTESRAGRRAAGGDAMAQAAESGTRFLLPLGGGKPSWCCTDANHHAIAG
jgi:hypothetical protein